MSVIGHLSGTVVISGDIVSPTGEVWDAERDEVSPAPEPDADV